MLDWRRSWLPLLGMLVVAGARAAVDTPTGAAATATGQEGTFSGLGLKLRPASIVTSGTIFYDLRASRGDGEGKNVAHLVTARLTADSYLYQPWFASVHGALGFTRSSSTDVTSVGGLPSEEAAHERHVSRERFLTGTGRVSLFPRSRFPFQIDVERSDSRIDSALASTLDFRTQSIGFSQRYQPAKGDYTVAGSFNRRDQWARNVRDTQYALTGDYTTRWKHHDASLGAAWSHADRRVTSEQSEFRSLVARHNFVPSPELALNTTANWSQTLERMTTAESDLAVLQWSTVGVWQREKSPWTLTGAVRGLALRDRVGEHDFGSLGMTVGTTYEVSRNGRLSGNASATFNDSGGSTSRAFNGSFGASWQGDTREFKGLRHDWFAAGTAGGSVSESGGVVAAGADRRQSQETAGVQLGHTLARNFPLTSQSAVAVNAGQTLALNAHRSSGGAMAADEVQVLRTLQHSAAATWNVAADTRNAYARISYNDSLELGRSNARFQLLNFQLSGNFNIDRNRTIGGDLTWQRAQQRSGGLASGLGSGYDRESSTNVGGEITYRHQRLFGFPRLRFSSRLKLAQDVLSQPGMLQAIPDRETRLWESRLDWSIGRLESQLVFRTSQVEGRRREFLTWRLERTFGN